MTNVKMQKLHLEDLPELVAALTEKIERLEETLQAMRSATSASIADDGLLTIDEASSRLRLTKNTLYGLVSKSKIPVSKRGKRLYFRRDELDRWVAEGRRKTVTEIVSQEQDYLQGIKSSVKRSAAHV